jgi:homoserine dehydrogenase
MCLFKIALFGIGTVGSGVYRILTSKSTLLKDRTGFALELVAVSDRSLSKKGKPRVSRKLFVRDWHLLLKNPEIQCVIELIGGTTTARQFVLEALRKGKDVVTANKALLAEHGNEIFAAARKYNRKVFFEASVCGGIPIIKSISEGLVANKIDSFYGIMNGTSNYILSEMSERGLSFKDALKQAQTHGFAERDPRLDLNGTDAAHKLAVLAGLVFGKSVALSQIRREGIDEITASDIAFADELGYKIKLLAVAKRAASGADIRVEPVLIPKTHILFSVNGCFNAVYLKGDEVGDMLLYGRGAGSRPTASAVVSDVVDWARSFRNQSSNVPMCAESMIVNRTSRVPSRYYLRFNVVDRPGVLSKISGVFGKYKVSISDLSQHEEKKPAVPLIFLTHLADEHAVRQAVHAIQKLNVVRGKSQVLRLEE